MQIAIVRGLLVFRQFVNSNTMLHAIIDMIRSLSTY